MANSDLKGKQWKIPRKYLKNLKTQLDNYTGNKHVVGYVRLQNLLDSGMISYENLKNVKHILDKSIDNQTTYNLNGGEHFHRWVNDKLTMARRRLEHNKQMKKDTGQENAYIKPHYKSSPSNTKTRMPKLHKSSDASNIFGNNVNYESKKHLKIVITEQQFNKIINTNG